MSDEGDRGRLEAIVFGRDAAVSDVERDAAAAQLARVLEETRAREAEAQTPVREVAEVPVTVAPLREDPAESPTEDPPREPSKPRWRRPLIMAGIALAVVIVAGVAAPALMSGRPLFGASDSMAIFDRPQTEQDLAYPPGAFGAPTVAIDSVRFLGEAEGYGIYAYLEDLSDYDRNRETMPCLLVVEGSSMTSNRCFGPEEFSVGPSFKVGTPGGWAEIAWDIENGLSVTHGVIPSPLSVFDEEQDDADLNALVYLPDIPPSQQDTVRFLNSSAGYYVAAYRDADDAVCLAVYEGGTTVATSESACVTEASFEQDGIQLIYPAVAPEISVTWGPTGVAFGGR